MRRSGSLLAGSVLVVGAVACTGSGSTASLASGNTAPASVVVPEPAACVRWVAPSGDDSGTGSRADPWATLEHAVGEVPDDRCTVFAADGVYEGSNSVDREFATPTVVRAANDYGATLRSDGSAVDVGTDASNLVFTGFEFTQTGPDATGVLVYVSGSDDGTRAPSHITFTNNVFHDSWGDDLLKIRSGATGVVVAGNVFYNQSDQGQGEQHIDVNSATDVEISDNVFFNDFTASGRPDARVSQHFIVVKDSGGEADGQLGSRRITIERNVFAHYEGDESSLIAIGNDGAPYHEAVDVLVRNNLVIGDGPDHAYAAFSVHGAKDVSFVNNTVTGDLPSSAFAFAIGTKGENPPNENLLFANNIWTDPTGTMGSLSGGSATDGAVLDRNLYWNAQGPVAGDLLGPDDDPDAVIADPGLPTDQRDITFPWWDGSAFASGDRTIGDAFVRLVTTYGAVPSEGAGVGLADVAFAPPTDILGRPRGDAPDLGAVEAP